MGILLPENLLSPWLDELESLGLVSWSGGMHLLIRMGGNVLRGKSVFEGLGWRGLMLEISNTRSRKLTLADWISWVWQ